LSALRDTVAASDVVALLCAVERVQSALDRDEAHRFASRLSGAGGLELIVEVAHDLRSPLASILFLAETLRKAQSGLVNSVQERQLGLIYSAAFGLSAMASDVIELARGGDRLVDFAPVPFSVADLLRSVRDIVQPMAEEKGLTVHLTTPDSDFRLGYPGALNRVLLNLTTNALKFTADGHVELGARQLSRTRLEFAVKDTGRGIPPEVMGCLFETFRRRRNAGEYTFSSAGLGLSICRKLVTAMGGDLRAPAKERDSASSWNSRSRRDCDAPRDRQSLLPLGRCRRAGHAVGAGDLEDLVGRQDLALEQRRGDSLDGAPVRMNDALGAIRLGGDEGSHRVVDLPLQLRARWSAGRRGIGADESDLVAHAELGDHAAGD
jgi:hypothetical protein